MENQGVAAGKDPVGHLSGPMPPSADPDAYWLKWQNRPATPPDPTAGLYNATAWTFGLSILLAPLAVASLILGAVLAGKGREGAGAGFMIGSIVILIVWGSILLGA